MKCPKCGFTSFDYLDECKKCGVDISDVRGHLGIIAVSPDERAAIGPAGTAADDVAAGDAAQQGAAGGLEGATFLGDDLSGGSFEDTFDSLMDEPGEEGVGSLDQDQGIVLDSPLPGPEAPPAQEAAAQAPGEDEEEFLDLDFGGIFDDEEEK